MDTVSNGGFLPFSAGASSRPCPGARTAIRPVRLRCSGHNFTLQYVFELPVKAPNRILGYAVNGCSYRVRVPA